MEMLTTFLSMRQDGTNQGMINVLSPRVKGLGSKAASAYLAERSGYGFCTRCGKKLKGDTSRELCYACWKEG